LIGGIQGCGYAGHPAIEEGLQVSRAEPITNCLQAVGVDTRCEPIGQFGKCESLSLSLSFSPLVAVHPNFAGIGEIRTHLDEAEPELGISDVEVVHGDTAVFFGEAIPRACAFGLPCLGRTVVRGQDGLELLGNANGDDAGLSSGLEVRLDDVDLPIALPETDDWDLMALGERGDCLAKTLAHLLEQGWRGDRLITLLVEKGDHLAANLQGRNVRVQVDTIQAFEVQHHVPIENLIDVADRCHAALPPAKLTEAIIALHIGDRKGYSAVRGWPH
jgi:hypothetical protein